MKIAIYGAGGVGGYFGGRLAQAGADVHLIARGDHLRALQQEGLRVESVMGDFVVDLPATDDPAAIGSCDVVLFTVKSYDTEAAAARLAPLLADDTGVISLQNGLDNEDVLADAIGDDHVMGGVAYIFSTIAEPGIIEHTGGPTTMAFGERDGTRSVRAERFLSVCERAEGMGATLSERIRGELWEKTAFICAHAGTTAAIRLPLGDIRDTVASWELYRQLVAEVCRVGRATGADVPEGTVDRWMDFAAGLDGDAYSSLHYDMTHGKPMELEGLHGAVVRRAEAHGVEVPATETIYAILGPWAERNRSG